MDRGLLLALRLQDRRALLAVGAHLLLHRVLDRGRRVDRLQLDAVDADAPLAGRLVEHAAELTVDLVAGRERALEGHTADDVSQRRHRQLLDRLDVVGDLIRRRLRIVDLEVDDGVDVDDEVVLGDHRLRREGHDLLPQVDQGAEPVDERNDDREPGSERAVVAPQPLDDAGARLRDDADRSRKHEQDEDCDDGDDDQRDHAAPLSMFAGARHLAHSGVQPREERLEPGTGLLIHERCRALDLHDLDLRARLDHLVRHERARRPFLAPDAHPAAGLVDALENDGMCALERGRTRPHRGRHAQMRARDRPEKADRRSGAGDEDGELDPHRCTERCGDGGRDRRERDGAEEEEARREHLAHGEQHSGDAPRKPAGHA
ncbi:MAG TPA: hypothetical protein VKC62_02425 [Gaiellaceae bacterium]|nr:hypothetical protein [Gaiellaceae bacterium]